MNGYVPLTDYVSAYLNDPNAPRSRINKRRAILAYEPEAIAVDTNQSSVSYNPLQRVLRALWEVLVCVTVLASGVGLMVGLCYMVQYMR